MAMQSMQTLGAVFGMTFSPASVQSFTAETTEALKQFSLLVGSITSGTDNAATAPDELKNLKQCFVRFLMHGDGQKELPNFKKGGTTAQRKKRRDKTAVATQPARINVPPRRSVNSYMAFRAYYQVIFNGTTQKMRSGFIRLLWGVDKCQNKWAMIADAYSTIRDDVGRAAAPFDVFLLVVCPYLNVIPPARYLNMMGWAFDADGTELVRRIPNINLSSSILTTNLTVGDIIDRCIAVGYYIPTAPNNNQVPTTQNNTTNLTMSVVPTTITVEGDGNTIIANPSADLAWEDIFGMQLTEPEPELAPSLRTQLDENIATLRTSGDEYPFTREFQLVADPDDTELHLDFDDCIEFAPTNIFEYTEN